MRIWKSYISFYKGQYFKFVLAISLSVLQSVIIVPIALLVRSVFDHALPEKNFSQLVTLCIIISILYIVNGGITLWTRHISLKTTKRVIRVIRNRIINKFYLLPKKYFTEIDRMKLHAGIVQDSFRLDVMSNGLVAQLLPAAFISTGLTLILLYLDLSLFLLVMIISPFLIIFGKFAGRILVGKINIYHRYFETFSKRVMVLLDNIDLARVSVTEKEEIREQGELHERIEKKSFDQAWFGAFYRILNETFTSSFGVVIMIFGGYRVINELMTIGDLFAFFTALGILKKYVVVISSVIPKVIEGNESLRSILEFLNEKMELPYSGTEKLAFKGEVVFESVSFSYDRGKLLENISFSIKPGEVVCITGPNGSGKSTIVNLILGFYRPESGGLRADGIKYEMIDMKDIRKSTGVVFQEMILFPGTIRENIVYGAGEYSEEDLKKVVELSGSREFIDKLPDGLETYIENKHERLSGGEAQKISIARSLLGDKKLIILDEPSSNLDKTSLNKIIGNLKKHMADRAILIISHKSEFAAITDKILEISGSTLITSGLPDISG